MRLDPSFISSRYVKNRKDEGGGGREAEHMKKKNEKEAMWEERRFRGRGEGEG